MEFKVIRRSVVGDCESNAVEVLIKGRHAKAVEEAINGCSNSVIIGGVRFCASDSHCGDFFNAGESFIFEADVSETKGGNTLVSQTRGIAL